ncbi:protein LSM14 homolog B isoform X2 [Diprion similis]|uniref:protein LSM14 homolog B isoform X2 n=1 Tax=Diprion similis TaxID=362088 RepID=UPI001EF8C10E|nr:protein LSM14 homolog B isoform X2 [Diprion similis]
MSAGMPELGSKISLISKADIRYEGRLFTVDPQECTIALANVRSFGTEDRETQFPVAPQNQVYEYILFRGSDIKDIRVVNNVSTIPNDPAIVQMTVQPNMGQPSYQPQPGFNHPMMGQIGPMGGQYGGGYAMGGMGAMGAMGPVMGMPAAGRDPRVAMNKQPSELGLGSTEAPNVVSIPNSIAPGNVDQIQKDQSLEDGVLDLISGGSRSTTPTSSLMTRKSPTMDQGTQVGHQQRPTNANIHKPMSDKPNARTIQPSYRDRESHGSGRTGSGMSQYSDGKRDNREKQDGNQLQGHGHPAGPNHAQMHQAGRGNRGGWIARGNIRGRGRGRGGGGGGTFRPPQPGSINNKPKNTLKFENDYDFEQANTQFEELRSQLAKTKIDNGTDNEKKDDSGNETGAGEGEPEEETDVVHYDKSKSFFDNISCEAVERSKGRSQRTDWRTERKLNSETFGVASTRRGGFRGRGYYNRGMGGGMYRGNNGYRGGYRGGSRGGGGGGNRQPSNQLHQQQQQQQQQQQKVLTNHNQNRPNNQQAATTTAQSQNSVVAGTA